MEALGKSLAERGQHAEAVAVWERRIPAATNSRQRASLFLLIAKSYFGKTLTASRFFSHADHASTTCEGRKWGDRHVYVNEFLQKHNIFEDLNIYMSCSSVSNKAERYGTLAHFSECHTTTFIFTKQCGRARLAPEPHRVSTE